jgi:NarL family two-component system sensor histidine kinase LiaS
MTFIRSLTHGLRGKLILTYTLVTVLALLALEVMLLAAVVIFSSITNSDKRAYLQDVISTLTPQARTYLQPGDEDLPGLQAWLDQVYRSGYASQEPNYVFDSPAAVIYRSEPMYVLSPEGMVLAQSPSGINDLTGQAYLRLTDGEYSNPLIQRVIDGENNTLQMIETTQRGNYRMVVPIRNNDDAQTLLGLVLVTILPDPPMILQTLPTYLLWVGLTGFVLLMAVVPFGALFGFIMSHSLTRRLDKLTSAADAWSEGNFNLLPDDRSKDEIGHLSMRMRNMAERLHNLLQTQQQLAMLEERNRLARELHDTIKQQIFAALMQVRAARNLMQSDLAGAGRHIEEAESLIKTSQQDLGQIISELRPAALDGQGLASALRVYAENWSKHARMLATLKVTNERALPFEIELALYRVAQEALSNVARHSHASAVTLNLDYSAASNSGDQARQVRLTIQDNGIGFEPAHPPRNGYGLLTMRERLETVKGVLEIHSPPGGGTTLTATVPEE